MTRRILNLLKGQAKRVFKALPERNYASPQYWQSRYEIQQLNYEWYVRYKEVKHFFNLHIPKSARILNIGNGTSSNEKFKVELPVDMYKDGYRNIHSIDIANSATILMNSKYNKRYPELICSFYLIVSYNYGCCQHVIP